MSLFLLDTNMASFAMKRQYPQVRAHLERAAKKHAIGISAVTQGELLYGLQRKGVAGNQSQALARTAEQLQELKLTHGQGQDQRKKQPCE